MFSSATVGVVGGLESSSNGSMAAVQLPAPAPAATAPAAAPTTTTAAADSSDVEKKIKDSFLKEMSKVIVGILNPYRTAGVITSTQDFKHLAKKVSSKSLSYNSCQPILTSIVIVPVSYAASYILLLCAVYFASSSVCFFFWGGGVHCVAAARFFLNTLIHKTIVLLDAH